MPLRRLVITAMFTALIAILAQVAVPLPFSPVPFTGQLIGVLLAGILLGGRGGAMAVFAYLMLGTAGAPVFAFGRGGIQVLLGPTGGYLIGFLPGVYLGGLLLERSPAPGAARTAGALAICLFFTYLLGTLQLALLMRFSPGEALLVGVIPYLPLDMAKLVLSASLGSKVRTSLQKHGLLTTGQQAKG